MTEIGRASGGEPVIAAALALLAAAAPLSAQLPMLPAGATDSAAVAAAEAEGRTFPRYDALPEYPPYDFPLPVTLVGTTGRECFSVPRQRSVVARSGEFAMGGYLEVLEHGRPMKLWWHPIRSRMDMVLLLRGRRLGGEAGDTLRFESTDVTAPRHSDTLEPYADEAFFITGPIFPSAGTWVVVATSRLNWGCFLMTFR